MATPIQPIPPNLHLVLFWHPMSGRPFLHLSFFAVGRCDSNLSSVSPLTFLPSFSLSIDLPVCRHVHGTSVTDVVTLFRYVPLHFCCCIVATPPRYILVCESRLFGQLCLVPGHQTTPQTFQLILFYESGDQCHLSSTLSSQVLPDKLFDFEPDPSQLEFIGSDQARARQISHLCRMPHEQPAN